MFTEKPMIEAVAAFFDNVAVYVHTGQEDDVLFPMEVFKMDELKKGDYRYVVDMPELPEEIQKRLGRQLEHACRATEKKEAPAGPGKEKEGKKEKASEKAVKDTREKKSLGETVCELRDQGLSYKEIADMLGRDEKGLSSLCSTYRKKHRQTAAEGTGAQEPEEEAYVTELAERTSIVSGKPVMVDIKKARALREAGWSMEKTADEFNISVKDLEELLA